MGGSTHFRFGHLVPNVHNKLRLKKKRQSPTDCSSGGFYTYPDASTMLNSLQPVNITWNTACLSGIDNLDIYLYAPSSGLENPRIHLWTDVSYSQGWYETSFKPRWWNSPDEIALQLNIVKAGDPPFMQTLPAAPIFKATYTATDGEKVPEDADTSIIDSGTTSALAESKEDSKGGMAPGKIAAAVIVPLLIIGILVGLAWLRIKRQRGVEKRKEWAEKVDKRMSTISTEWKSMSGAGANAAIRNSIAVSGNRNSSFSFGAIRPPTVYEDGGRAGVGATRQSAYGTVRDSAYGGGVRESAYGPRPSFSSQSQQRQSVFTQERQSRVSFALDAHPRPSMNSEGRSSIYTNRPSRAFHSAYIPPVPAMPTRKDSTSSDSTEDPGMMSPTQTVGAAPLTAEAINARFSYYNYEGYEGENVTSPTNVQSSPSTSSGAQEAERQESYVQEIEYPELLFHAGLVTPTTPAPAYTPTSSMALTAPTQSYTPTTSSAPSPAHDMFSGFATPATEGSPDEMLRAYAAAARASRTITPVSATAETSPDEMLRAYAAARSRTPTIKSPPPVIKSPEVKSARRLTFNTTNPGTYSPSRGAYGVDTKWE